MVIYHSHKERQQCHNQPKRLQMNAPSTYSLESENAGEDPIKCTDSSIDGFNVITAASPGAVSLFSDVAPPSIYFPGLPRPFGTGRSFVDEHIYWAENHDKAKLLSQGASILCKYDVDFFQKTEHARPLQCNEPTGKKAGVRWKRALQKSRNPTSATTTMPCFMRGTPSATETHSSIPRPLCTI
ncbi:uncharacterized protein LOC142570959 [Dermacentor variabilis]|uniref:uncharacterized protein LOC142570959 n=1 Tax=Dermacentor variabilis TaxID=34621 RepID=UPI003F5C6E40